MALRCSICDFCGTKPSQVSGRSSASFSSARKVSHVSIAAASYEFAAQRLPDNRHIERESAAAAIDTVESYAQACAFLIGRRPTITLCLGESGEPRPHMVPREIEWHQVLIHLARRQHADGVRARSYEGHFSANHVEKLRQLVDVVAPQKCTHPGDARI